MNGYKQWRHVNNTYLFLLETDCVQRRSVFDGVHNRGVANSNTLLHIRQPGRFPRRLGRELIPIDGSGLGVIKQDVTNLPVWAYSDAWKPCVCWQRGYMCLTTFDYAYLMIANLNLQNAIIAPCTHALTELSSRCKERRDFWQKVSNSVLSSNRVC